jgi:hypothetical protein
MVAARPPATAGKFLGILAVICCVVARNAAYGQNVQGRCRIYDYALLVKQVFGILLPPAFNRHWRFRRATEITGGYDEQYVVFAGQDIKYVGSPLH